MARNEKPRVETGGIPAWFMTYSDVITLLMTFFILLLTFATNEPEKFAQMQAVTFGGGKGATGVAGAKSETVDKDTLIIRSRPSAARIGSGGSELPPVYTDPVRESLGMGLKSLDDSPLDEEQPAFHFEIPWALLFDAAGRPTTYVHQRLRMLGAQMRALPLQLKLSVSTSDDLSAAVDLADVLSQSSGVAAGRIRVGVRSEVPAPKRALQLSVSWGLAIEPPAAP